MCLEAGFSIACLRVAGTSVISGGSIERVLLAGLTFDATADLVAVAFDIPTTTSSVIIHRANGDATFGAPTSHSLLGRVGDVRAADVNRDGIPDLVVGTTSNPHIAVFLGVGDGTFQPALDTPAPGAVRELAVVNADNDPELDVVALVGAEARLFPGIGNGSFGSSFPMISLSEGACLAVGDIDRNGDVEVALGLSAKRSFTFIDDPAFVGPFRYSPFGVPTSVRLGRVDADGLVDLVAHDAVSGLVWVYPNTTPDAPVDGPPDVTAATGACLYAPFVQPGGGVRIRYALARPEAARLSVYDVRGRHVWSASPLPTTAGTHLVTWDGRASGAGLAARGVYFVHLSTPSARLTRKLPLVQR